MLVSETISYKPLLVGGLVQRTVMLVLSSAYAGLDFDNDFVVDVNGLR